MKVLNQSFLILQSRLMKSPAVLISVWFGLVYGLFEGIAKIVIRKFAENPISVSVDILWIAPAFYLIFFLLVGVFISLFFRLIKKPVDVRVITGIFIWLVLFGVLLLIGKINRFASMALSLGIGIEVGRRFGIWIQRRLPFFLRSLGVLIIIAVVVGVCGAFEDDLRNSFLVRRLPPPALRVPNIILITLDTLRADHISVYGYERLTTPNIDRMAQKGVLFENAFTNSSWTLPAHATMFTGRYLSEHKADWETRLDDRFPTLAEALAHIGYLTGAFSANTYFIAPEWGMGRGFTHFEVYGSSLVDDAIRTVYGKRISDLFLPRLNYYDIPGRKRADEVNREFLNWIDRNERDRPFFAFLNYMDVHDPYLTYEHYQTRFSNNVTMGDVINHQYQQTFRRKPVVTPEEIQMEINGYDGVLSYLDAQLGVLFSELETRQLTKDTLVVITSDHGESFNEHELFGHGNSLYIETLHVPLIFYWPGKIPSGIKVSQLASLHQIPITIMDIIGINSSGTFPGVSLTSYWTDGYKTKAPSPVYAELTSGRFINGPESYPTSDSDLQTLVTDKWQFILSNNGEVELYSWREDRQETLNLADKPSSQVILDEFRLQLKNLRNQIAVENKK